MLRSMTGYGEATVETDEFVLQIEIKTVNGKFMKICSRLPEEISYVQNKLEETVRTALQRGTATVTVRFEPRSNADLYQIDEEVVRKYFRTLGDLSREFDESEPIQLRDVLALPGVIRAETCELSGRDRILPVALKVTAEALENLTRMREIEGQSLEREFRERGGILAKLLKDIKKIYPKCLEEHHGRLLERVNLLLRDGEVSLKAEDLAKEVAILAERSDIAEEVTRLESHLEQFEATLQRDGEPAGRRLEFIVQEMFRECNTIGSKSTNPALSQCVVDMKAEVNRLKEQVLNVE